MYSVLYKNNYHENNNEHHTYFFAYHFKQMF